MIRMDAMWEDDPQPLPCFDPFDRPVKGPRRSCRTPQQNGGLDRIGLGGKPFNP